MDNSKDSTRLKRITNEFADSVENNITDVGRNIISVLINDAGTWLMGIYEKWKRSQSTRSKVDTLQKYIDVSNEATQIEMDKKELAVMWAMHELGYSEEETLEVLNLANKAYLPKEERET